MEQVSDAWRKSSENSVRMAEIDARLERWCRESNYNYSEEEQRILFRTSMRSFVPAAVAGYAAYAGFSQVPSEASNLTYEVARRLDAFFIANMQFSLRKCIFLTRQCIVFMFEVKNVRR